MPRMNDSALNKIAIVLLSVCVAAAVLFFVAIAVLIAAFRWLGVIAPVFFPLVITGLLVRGQWRNIRRRFDDVRLRLKHPRRIVPWRCFVVDPPKAVIAGEMLRFFVQGVTANRELFSPGHAEEGSSNTVQLAVTGSNEYFLRVDEKPDETGRFAVQFLPRRAARYSLCVRWNGEVVQNGSFGVTVIPGPIDPPSCRMECTPNSKMPIAVGRPLELVLLCRDRFGNPVRGVPSDGVVVSMNAQPIDAPARTEGDSVFIHIQAAADCGIHQLRIQYNGLELGKFELCIVDHTTWALLQSSIQANTWYIRCQVGEQHGYLYVTPRSLSVKKFYIGLIPTKLYAWRLSTSLGITFAGDTLHINDEADTVAITFPDRREIHRPALTAYAMAMSFLYSRFTTAATTFEAKKRIIAARLKELQTKKKVPGEKSIHVLRSDLSSALRIMKGFNEIEWRQPWRVTFISEHGVDCGGLRKEFFTIIARELILPTKEIPAFVQLSPTRRLLHPNSFSMAAETWKLCGQFIAKVIHDAVLGTQGQCLVPCHFTRSFRKIIVGTPVHFADFESDDPELYKNKILFILENDVDDLELTFTDEVFDSAGKLVRVAELKRGGASLRVTNDNKREYLMRLARFRLEEAVQQQCKSFLEGFYSIIPEDAISLFDEGELQLLISGSETISWKDMRDNCRYDGFRPSDQAVEWLWALLGTFTQEDLSQLLQFVVGCPAVPAGGFANLQPRFTLVRTNSDNCDAKLPTARTCFNQLQLPAYSSYELLEKKLRLAMTDGAEGFAFS
eukprot:TRINITY_DN54073_c0_g1_i1.p1 TRINITY_DN54073_c0_g1~~TRINITY_DN54073_c0_g1_i1.p1  ORF type:complete len:793 (-),score=106.89 TRINITY_DN54073_c0_g1_i1:10-2364(-)